MLISGTIIIMIIIIIMNEIHCDVQLTTSRLFLGQKMKFHLMKINTQKYCYESLHFCSDMH